MPMRFNFRLRIPLLSWLRVNIGKRGASLTAHKGRWSANSRGSVTYDTPGPGSVTWTPSKRRPRRRRTRR